MASATELERLTVKLMGDGSSYDRTIKSAIRATNIGAKKIDTAAGKMTRGFNRATAAVKRYGVAIAGAGRKLRNFGTMVAVGVTLPVVALGYKFLSAAASAEEMKSKFDNVFGAAGGGVGAEMDEFAKAAGRSKYELRTMAADLGALVKPMGFTEEATGKMSTKLVKLAEDLGSYFDTSSDEALTALRAGLVGESEPLRRFGVQLSAAKIQAEAFTMGLVEEKEKVEGAAKALAIMSLVMKQTKDAQGDAIKTQASYTNQVKRMKGAFKDLSTELGNYLIPFMTKLVGKVTECIEWFRALDTKIQKVILAVAGAVAIIGPLIIAIGLVSMAVGGLITMFTMLNATSIFWILAGTAIVGVMIALYDSFTNGSLGFNKFVGSIRIGGTQIKTWVLATATYVWQAWDWAVNKITLGWEAVVVTVQNVGGSIHRAMLITGKAIYETFWWAVKEAAGALNWLGLVSDETFNALEEHGNRTSEVYDQATADSLSADTARNDAFAESVAKLDREGAANAKGWEDTRTQLFLDDEIAKIAEEKAAMEAAAAKAAKDAKALALKDRVKKELAAMSKAAKDLAALAAKDAKAAADLAAKNAADLATAGAAPDAAGGVGGMEQQTNFKQVALNRISLAGMTGFAAPKKEEVEAPGVEKKLDTLIGVTRQQQAKPVVVD